MCAFHFYIIFSLEIIAIAVSMGVIAFMKAHRDHMCSFCMFLAFLLVIFSWVILLCSIAQSVICRYYFRHNLMWQSPVAIVQMMSGKMQPMRNWENDPATQNVPMMHDRVDMPTANTIQQGQMQNMPMMNRMHQSTSDMMMKNDKMSNEMMDNNQSMMNGKTMMSKAQNMQSTMNANQ